MTDSTDNTGTFTTTSWDEQAWSEPEDGPKLTTAKVTNAYEGLIAAEALLEMLLFYEPKAEGQEGWGRGTFLALEHVTGSLAGRRGAFVVRQQGTFDGSKISAELTIEPGSGTGDLAGLTGSGTYAITMGDPVGTYAFDYAFGT